MDLLQGEFGAVVPALVVHVLADQRVGLHGAVGVHLRHVHVVNEVDQLLGARGAKVAAGFLLQGLLQNAWGTKELPVREIGLVEGRQGFSGNVRNCDYDLF